MQTQFDLEDGLEKMLFDVVFELQFDAQLLILGKPSLAIVPGCISFILMGVAIIHLFVFFPSGTQNRIDVRDGSHRLLPYSGE
jgi:hypothetical protein